MPRTTLRIEGMTCDHCRGRVEKALLAVPGTESATVDLARKEATVSGSAEGSALRAAVEKAGFKVA